MTERSWANLFFIVLLVVSLLVLASQDEHPQVPQCAEDAVLIGAGDFNDGRWERYECGPAVDDFD